MIPRFLLAFLIPLLISMAADPIPLWPKGAPGALGVRPEDTPTVTPFLPDPAKASGTAIIVCPGGAYKHLAGHEGEGYARWLSDHGVAAFVLKYRLATDGYHHPAMLNDAARALRLVRSRAAEWKVNPARIGIMGSSAGGHLASTLLTHFETAKADATDPIERESSRPDFGILCYPVITMGAGTHAGSRQALLGDHPPAELAEFLSSEKQLRADTPPCFIWHTVEDPGVSVDNSLAFAAALRAKAVPFELHIYEKGGHGMGLGHNVNDPSRLHPWTDDLLCWLDGRGLLKP
jgi:acetyl esterase/lipase